MITREHICEEIRRMKEHGHGVEDMEHLLWMYMLKERMEEHEEEHEEHGKLTMEQAREWVNGMEGTDPAKPNGGKWSMEEAWSLAKKMGLCGDSDDMVEFYAVLNAMHSDYFEVAKKHGVATPNFFADLACAWLNDKDAVEGKAKAYFEHVVK